MSATVYIQKLPAEEEVKNVLEQDYPNGDYDVIRAQVLSGWDDDLQWSEIVAIVYATKTTALSMTTKAADTIFEHVDLNDSGFITAMEFQEALQDPQLQALLKTLKQPALLKMLKNPTVRCSLCYRAPAINPYIVASFKKIHGLAHDLARSRSEDLDRKGSAESSLEMGEALPSAKNAAGDLQLNKTMFSDWIVGMREERLRYYMKNMLIKQKCYMGFGMQHNLHRGCCKRCCHKYWCCCMYRGLLDDLVVHARNHHPLFSPWYAHKDHPYSKREKFIALYVSTMTTFGGTGLALATETTGWTLIVMNFFFATLTTMLMTTVMYYLMACPCTVHDESSSSDCKNWCLKRLEGIGTSCGKIMLLIGATFMAIGLVFFIQFGGGGHGMYAFFASWFEAQFLWFATKLSVEFNPFKTVAFTLNKFTCGLVGFGRWHRDRDKVLKIVRKVIEERGEAYLLIEDKELDDSLHSPTKEKVQEEAVPIVVATDSMDAPAVASTEVPVPAAEDATPTPTKELDDSLHSPTNEKEQEEAVPVVIATDSMDAPAVASTEGPAPAAEDATPSPTDAAETTERVVVPSLDS